MTHVTPYLPKVGNLTARDWRDGGKPAFVRAFEQRLDACPNCQGVGFVVLILADKGPLRSPALGRAVSTWYDGDGVNGKGWYTVNNTICYTCPECKGVEKGSDKPYVLPPQRAIEKLADEKGIKKHD